MEWLNYHHLYYFWNVVQVQSFTTAAKNLKVSQSAVSEQIRALEEQFGVKLLERQRRKALVVTDAGQIVYNYADQIFQIGHELTNWAKGNKATLKRLRVGVLTGLSRYFQLEFLKPILQQKNLNFEIVTADSMQLELLLDQYRIDVVLTTRSHMSRVAGRHVSRRLGTTPVVLVEASARPLRQMTLRERLGDALFIPSALSDLRPQVEAVLVREEATPTLIGEVDDIAMLRLLALEGGGVAIVPKIGILNEIKEERLRIISDFPELSQSFYVVSRMEHMPLQELQDLIKAFEESLMTSNFFYH